MTLYSHPSSSSRGRWNKSFAGNGQSAPIPESTETRVSIAALEEIYMDSPVRAHADNDSSALSRIQSLAAGPLRTRTRQSVEYTARAFQHVDPELTKHDRREFFPSSLDELQLDFP
jgi:hypothetical protein